MREILFRGKKTTSGEWVVGNYARNVVDAKFDTIEDCENFPYLIYGIDRKTVGQYTGLTDKNGKRIFEGDLVEVDNDGIYEIRFNNADAGFEMRDICLRYAFLLERGTRMTIIGNIYDNKELLHDCEVEG